MLRRWLLVAFLVGAMLVAITQVVSAQPGGFTSWKSVNMTGVADSYIIIGMSGVSTSRFKVASSYAIVGAPASLTLTMVSEHEVFISYPTIEDLIRLARAGDGDYVKKDEVFGILLKDLKQRMVLFPLLNLMLWESLLRIFHTYREAVVSLDELFVQVQLFFFQTAIEYPLERRPRKMDVNLVLDTRKKVVQWMNKVIC